MRQDDVLVKWTGSKRIQSSQIVSHFPRSIKTYYEPCLGGGSILYNLFEQPIQIDRIECSDINNDLIAIWQLVKNSPQELLDCYNFYWPFNSEKYYRLRQEYNSTRDPKVFFCLIRNSRNGLIRYNKKGDFTSAFHEKRKGIKPSLLETTTWDWHNKMKSRNIHFYCRDYQSIQPTTDDFVYLDPPYITSSHEEFYFGEIDFTNMCNWLAKQSCDYAISTNKTMIVPQHLWTKHYEIDAGFHRMNRNEKINVYDSLYLKEHKHDET